MSTRDGLSKTGAETTPADDTRVQEPCGLSQGEPEPDGHSLGEPEPDGHSLGKPKPDGHSLAEHEPDGHSLGEPQPDGHSLGEPQPDGHSLGESEHDGHSLGEREPDGYSLGEPEPDGHSLGEREPYGQSLGEPDGHSLGEREFGLPKQGATEPDGRPNQEEIKPSSRDQEESETAQTSVNPDKATKGQYSGLGVTEPPTDVSEEIGKGQASLPTTSRTSLVCGILQIALGVVAVGLAIGLLSFWEKKHYARDGIGIMGGALFMVAGISGIISSRTRQRRHITTCMVLSIIAAVFSGFLPVFTVVHGAFSHKIWHGFAAFLCAITAVSFLEMVVSIVQSVMCCRVTCCATRPSTVSIGLSGV